ncbi:cupin domain-containing protein [Magnetococcus marinus]|nr:cupin domain-containing protein [Magnetococcus marinus]
MIQRFEWPNQAAMEQEMRQLGCYPITYHYAPNSYFAPHTHGVDKIVGVVAGCFLLRLQGQRVELGPMQGVRVPALVRHDAEVVGEETVISVDALAVAGDFLG